MNFYGELERMILFKDYIRKFVLRPLILSVFLLYYKSSLWDGTFTML